MDWQQVSVNASCCKPSCQYISAETGPTPCAPQMLIQTVELLETKCLLCMASQNSRGYMLVVIEDGFMFTRSRMKHKTVAVRPVWGGFVCLFESRCLVFEHIRQCLWATSSGPQQKMHDTVMIQIWTCYRSKLIHDAALESVSSLSVERQDMLLFRATTTPYAQQIHTVWHANDRRGSLYQFTVPEGKTKTYWLGLCTCTPRHCDFHITSSIDLPVSSLLQRLPVSEEHLELQDGRAPHKPPCPRSESEETETDEQEETRITSLSEVEIGVTG